MARASRRARLSSRAALGLAALLILVAIYVADQERRREPPVFPSEKCAEAYRRFYRKPEVDLRVVFGYKDARPARFVADRYEHLNFVQTILSRCEGGNQACGFSRMKDEDDLFVRKIHGPDGEPRTVRLRIIQSSAGPDDGENRNDPFQAWRTRYAQEAFLSGLVSADAVFYNGHSRGGGGPDFGPPRMGSAGEVDFEKYREEQPGLRQVTEALGRGSDLQLLGLFSCASSHHFVGRVNAVAPRLGMISSSELLYFSDAMESLQEAVSGLLSLRCDPDFTQALNAPINEKETRAATARVSRFF